MKKPVEFKEVVAHFPAHMSQELCDYVRDVVFLTSRYIFARREGKKQYGYCTYCCQENETPGLKHGTTAICISCGSACGVKASGKGRKSLVDEAYFVYYEKSVANPEAITARGIYAVRDYREGYRAVETQIQVKAMYLFEPGHCVMFERKWLYYSYESGMRYGEDWHQLKSISSLSNSVMMHKPCFCSYDSIRSAIQDTPFQYSTWEHYRKGDMVKFFDLYAKYPCIEYLTKLGMRGLVDAKLDGDRTYNVVNWRGKNLLKVLKMSKQELKELREAKVRVDPWLLYLWSIVKKDGSRLSITETARISYEITEIDHESLQTALHRTNLRRLNAYLTKQLENPEVNQRYRTKHSLLHTWNDYIADCHRLGLNVSDEPVKFPKNLYNAHQNTIKQIKLKADEALAAKFIARYKALQKYRFEALGFMLRPAASARELIDEGKALHHCVGTYADRYANGNTGIFFLRKASEPDMPFYTVEIVQDRIVQCRGLNNCLPTEDVQAFIDLFAVMKLTSKKQTSVSVAV